MNRRQLLKVMSWSAAALIIPIERTIFLPPRRRLILCEDSAALHRALAEARDGDTLILQSGTVYQEPLSIPGGIKQLTLMGDSYTGPERTGVHFANLYWCPEKTVRNLDPAEYARLVSI